MEPSLVTWPTRNTLTPAALAPGPWAAWCHDTLALIAVLTGYILAALLALIISAALLYWLLNLAERHGGYNGDFMGAGIVLVELGVLLAFALG